MLYCFLSVVRFMIKNTNFGICWYLYCYCSLNSAFMTHNLFMVNQGFIAPEQDVHSISSHSKNEVLNNMSTHA